MSAVSYNSKRWCDLRANLFYSLNNLKLWCPPWPSCANKYSAPYRPDFGRNLGLEILEKLETWNCLHKTFRASTGDFKRWCDLRANLHYGLNVSKFCARPWPSCANKCSAHSRPDFRWNLKFSWKTWNLELFAQDVPASAWDFKRWCDLRANLHYGLNNSNIC